jgi:glycogen operon protein
MLTAGDEMGRTQQGNNNAYCQDNEVSWVDWDEATHWSDITELTRTLLALRARHPVFRQRHFFTGIPAVPGGRKDIAWFGPDGDELTEPDWWGAERRTLGLFLAGDAIRSRNPDGTRVLDDSFLLLLHADPDPIEFVLPDHEYWADRYEAVLDSGHPQRVGEVVEAKDRLLLAGRSSLLLRALEEDHARRG